MLAPQVEIMLVAALAGAACALPGVFLFLRRMALVGDAISHAILFGIVVTFLIVRDLRSPWLLIGAAGTGVLTAVAVDALRRTGRVKEDAALGLVFPALFSLGVVGIARGVGNIHLDLDAVLLGELAFAPFDRLIWGGWDLGPRGAWVMGGLLLLNLTLILVFYKEWTLSTFDPDLAEIFGFRPAVLHYLLMGMTALTVVAAFDVAGVVLVVAMLVVPPATAALLTDRLAHMLGLSVLLGLGIALGGYGLAYALDLSIAGSMATVGGILFVLVFLGAPGQGLIAQARQAARQRQHLAQQMLVIHLLSHEGTEAEYEENCLKTLPLHLRWDPAFAAQVIQRAERVGWVVREGELLRLTEAGRRAAREIIGSNGGMIPLSR
ncbi:metal ABC transporter permease [Thermoflexus sp.]|uniref:metal ABC transporter permease n=1 Tax=Thermoflexus sp. TaxID=1969742 RepID=UPI0025FFAD0C|nr:metal ABC transporter permease [Thermoflexus sp.]MDW8181177.1 metal ABC transporter permease [Anaerolineae bacterium]MCS6963123.1 metal ABC transporter permease [Thermoflexus sp.]MCS7351719.1 metal ABC transporter permease [Thermoflexus sp.]MCX7690481.1 metal ABC transporter permease [Thermoflexus sp.]MDW8185143.1 metal ABC transporter permease [Anaerolineae bacterium]